MSRLSVVLLASLCWPRAVAATKLLALEPCQSKASYTPSKCPAGTALACWSAAPQDQWVCLDAAGVGPTSPKWDVHCALRGTVPGSRQGRYSGGCTFEVPSAAVRELEALPEPISWDRAAALATETLAAMTRDEKYFLLQGVDWMWNNSGTAASPNWTAVLERFAYVGTTPAIPRLGIPSLKMQDAAGGFRTYWNDMVGTVTVWPSLLSLAATWDPAAVRDFALALGKEFAEKGANGILGPSLQVHRVARNGRNFEYLSGEDPYLGSQLVKAYVEGVQHRGVLAVMKHWIFNDQETNRMIYSSNVDAKTAWELYYQPFQAAVDAGVSAAMCSYNRIGGVYSCSNKEQLSILKERMGFRGFVQSDWWATHNSTLEDGLDQEMPGIGLDGNGNSFDASKLSRSSPEAVDDAARRVLQVMRKLDLAARDRCTPPDCGQFLLRDVTSDEHSALARKLAADSVVVLKNDGDVLPLSLHRIRNVAIIGAAAVARPYNPNGLGQGQGDGWAGGDYYSGGGSGHVVAARVVTPLDGLSSRAELGGFNVAASPTDDLDAALLVADQADVTIVVGGATSEEGSDRENLNLDGDVDRLISQLANRTKCPRVVVVAMVPGAVLMPWRHSVHGILVLFLGGQETGAALADIIFGDQLPSGRLPLMMPESEADTIPPVAESLEINYTEGLSTSYRNKEFKAAFPFGHGLSFSSFSFDGVEVKLCDTMQPQALVCIALTVRNSGKRPARAVPQLYLELSQEAQWPTPFLKGFKKTGVLLPGSAVEVTFQLTARDLSYFDPNADGWVLSSNATAHFGESSASWQLAVPFLVPQEAAAHAAAAPPRSLRGRASGAAALV